MASLGLVLAAGAATAVAGEAAWRYEVSADLLDQGSASTLAVHDGNVFFTTFRCVYNMGTGTCVNATGELLKLGGSTGTPYWSYRFEGAGLTGIGFPKPPLLVPGRSGLPTSAVLLGAEATPDAGEGHFRMFQASLELKGAVTCDVPVASGNRLEHPANHSSKTECESAGACWDDGSVDRCGLHPTAQIVDCGVPNPEAEQDCSKLGCCWDGAYQPGRCFKGSPQCYAKSEDESGGWQTPRPGPLWTSLAAIAPAAAAGKPSIIVYTECKEYPGLDGCSIAAFSAQGTKTGKGGTQELWRVPLPSKCSSSEQNEACLCPGMDKTVSAPAVGGGAAFISACTFRGPVLLALSLSTGRQLWAPQLLQEMSPGYEMIYSPPRPVYSERFKLVYIGFQTAITAVSARRADTGAQAWLANLHGYECTSMRWVDTGVISPDGSQLVLWDNFGTRAVAADTGSALWKSSGFAAGNGHFLPGISFAASPKGEEVLLVLGCERPASCEAAYHKGPFFVQAVRLKDGALVGRATSPSTNILASAIPPVAVGNLWVHGDTSNPPRMHSTIFALEANFTDTAVDILPLL